MTSKKPPKITSFRVYKLLREFARLRREAKSIVGMYQSIVYGPLRKCAESAAKKGLMQRGYEVIEWVQPDGADGIQVGSGNGSADPRKPDLPWEQQKRNHDIEQDVLANKLAFQWCITDLGLQVFESFEFPLPREAILPGHTYRAKRRKVGMFDTSDDRYLVYVGGNQVQYDSDTVRTGRKYPMMDLDEFRFWAHSDVTAEYQKQKQESNGN